MKKGALSVTNKMLSETSGKQVHFIPENSPFLEPKRYSVVFSLFHLSFPCEKREEEIINNL